MRGYFPISTAAQRIRWDDMFFTRWAPKIVINGVDFPYKWPKIHGLRWCYIYLVICLRWFFYRIYDGIHHYCLPPFGRTILRCFNQPTSKSKKDDTFWGDEIYFTRWYSDNEGTAIGSQSSQLNIYHCTMCPDTKSWEKFQKTDHFVPCFFVTPNWSLTFHDIISVGGPS